MPARELTMEELLAVVGDLELERRKLIRYTLELELRVAALEAEKEPPDEGVDSPA